MRTHDLRQALRIFRREPAFAAAAVLTLTLGIGANTALFAVVEAVLLRPLPFDDADRARRAPAPRRRDRAHQAGHRDRRLRRSARAASGRSSRSPGSAASSPRSSATASRSASRAPSPRPMRSVRCAFDPSLGRLLRGRRCARGAAPVAIVSHEFWRTQLGSDPRALTRSIQLGTTRRMVVGVLPPGFRIPGDAEDRRRSCRRRCRPRRRRSAGPAGSTASDVCAPVRRSRGAQAELAALSRQFEVEFPQQNQGSRYEALALRDALVGDTRRPLLLLLAAVGLRPADRVRQRRQPAAGARAWTPAGAGDAAGARRRPPAARRAAAHRRARARRSPAASPAWSWRGVRRRRWRALIPNASLVPGLEQVGISVGVLLFALAAAVVVGAAVQRDRLRAACRASTGVRCRASARGTMTPGAKTAASGLVAVGDRAGRRAAGRRRPDAAQLREPARGRSRLHAGRRPDRAARPARRPLRRRTRRVAPSTRARSPTSTRCPRSRPSARRWSRRSPATTGRVPLQRVEHPVAPGQRPPEVGWQLASAGYFRALRIPLRAGRLFEPRDATGPPVVIVSEAVAARFFPGETPVGHRISLGDMEAEIVGVVGNIRRASLTDEPRADLYFPFERENSPADDAVHPRERRSGRRAARRARGGPPARAARGAVRDAHAGAHRRGVGGRDAAGDAPARRLRGDRARARGRRHLRRDVVSRAAPHARARHAAGARREPCATSSGWCCGRPSRSRAVGLAIGTAATLVIGRTLSSVLFQRDRRGIRRRWASAAALLAVATVAASYLPARRAARVDPVSVLSAE